MTIKPAYVFHLDMYFFSKRFVCEALNASCMCSAGVCCVDERAECLPGAAPGEGGGDRRAQGGEEQHAGKMFSGHFAY